MKASISFRCFALKVWSCNGANRVVGILWLEEALRSIDGHEERSSLEVEVDAISIFIYVYIVMDETTWLTLLF